MQKGKNSELAGASLYVALYSLTPGHCAVRQQLNVGHLMISKASVSLPLPDKLLAPRA